MRTAQAVLEADTRREAVAVEEAFATHYSAVFRQVQRLMPRGGAHLVVGEVPAAQGIADITAVRFDVAAVRKRLDAGIGPVTSPLRVRVLHLLRADRAMRSATLAGLLGSWVVAVGLAAAWR